MSRDVPPRGRLTDALVDHLEAAPQLTTRGILFGDGIEPPAAGWDSLEPGVGKFVASVVLTTRTATPVPTEPETLRSAHTSWRCGYGLRATGGTRTQADFAADMAREAIAEFPTGDIEAMDGWKLQQVLIPALAMVRVSNPTQDNPTFVLDDTVEVWITRSAR